MHFACGKDQDKYFLAEEGLRNVASVCRVALNVYGVGGE